MSLQLFWGLIVTALSLLFALVCYLARDSLYRWIARHTKKKVCDPSL